MKNTFWQFIKRIKIRYVIIGLLLVFATMQLFPIDKKVHEHHPTDDILIAENASPEVVSIMKKACYDCHSYETTYPWYSNVAPVSWWTKNHVNEARQEINFNDWTHFGTKRQDKKIHECIKTLQEGEMPLDSYTWLHKEARLTSSEKALLINWFQSLLLRNS